MSLGSQLSLTFNPKLFFTCFRVENIPVSQNSTFRRYVITQPVMVGEEFVRISTVHPARPGCYLPRQLQSYLLFISPSSNTGGVRKVTENSRELPHTFAHYGSDCPLPPCMGGWDAKSLSPPPLHIPWLARNYCSHCTWERAQTAPSMHCRDSRPLKRG